MTREQANDLLNAVAAGADVPLEKINEALVLTGDAKTMTKTKIETACEGVQAVGTPATVTQVAEALGLPIQGVRAWLKNARAAGLLDSDGKYAPRYTLSQSYLAQEKARAQIEEIRKSGALAGYKTGHERAAAVIEALGVAGVWEVRHALEAGPRNASRYVSVALTRRWIVLATDGGVRKYAATQMWRDRVARMQEPATPAVAPVDLKAEQVGTPSWTWPLVGHPFYGAGKLHGDWSRA